MPQEKEPLIGTTQDKPIHAGLKAAVAIVLALGVGLVAVRPECLSSREAIVSEKKVPEALLSEKKAPIMPCNPDYETAPEEFINACDCRMGYNIEGCDKAPESMEDSFEEIIACLSEDQKEKFYPHGKESYEWDETVEWCLESRCAADRSSNLGCFDDDTYSYLDSEHPTTVLTECMLKGWKDMDCTGDRFSCYDTDDGKTDPKGRACTMASSKVEHFSGYNYWGDDHCEDTKGKDFDATVMCCGCGGGDRSGPN